MPHTPLRRIPGEENVATIEDVFHDILQAPTTTTDGGTTDIGEVSDEGMVKYHGRNAGSIDSLNRDSIASVSDGDHDHDSQGQNDRISSDEDDTREINNVPKENGQGYNTTESLCHEAIEMQIMAQVYDIKNMHEENMSET